MYLPSPCTRRKAEPRSAHGCQALPALQFWPIPPLCPGLGGGPGTHTLQPHPLPLALPSPLSLLLWAFALAVSSCMRPAEEAPHSRLHLWLSPHHLPPSAQPFRLCRTADLLICHQNMTSVALSTTSSVSTTAAGTQRAFKKALGRTRQDHPMLLKE